MMALGAIALNYGQLENIYRTMFSYVTGLNEFQTAAIFHRLPNNQRKDVLHDIMAKTILPPKLKELVEYFAKGFAICADNRHDIMHSSSGGRHRSMSTGATGIVLKKYTKAGNKVECYATVELLRSVADTIHDYAVYGSKVASAVILYRELLSQRREHELAQLPSFDRPAPPTRMSWRSPADPKASAPLPQSSGG